MPASIDELTLGVIQSLYDAAMDEALWPHALQRLTDYTGSQAATFWTLDSSGEPRLPILTIYNFDPDFMREYLAGMVPHDPTVQYLVQHPAEGIVHDGLVISEREKDRHHYYDWHGRHSETRFRMVGQAHPAPGAQAGVALHRTQHAGRYESDDLERFSFVYAHLQRALAIGFRLGSLSALNQATVEVLDRNSAAIVLLDDQRRVVLANRAADALRTASDGAGLSSKGVVLARRQDQAKLNTLIAEALSDVTLPVSGGFMRASRPSGKRPYAILVAQVRGRYPALSTLRPAICILITDPEAKIPLPVDRLRSAFGLTSAEAKLAAVLGSGEDLRSAAAKLEITYGTARVRLADIFQKTQTRRQAELVQVLLATLVLR
jgi:DNA-binding CsgD family transcriptional regulator